MAKTKKREYTVVLTDTVVSMERGDDKTIVTTRWGRTDILETLEQIKQLADEGSLNGK